MDGNGFLTNPFAWLTPAHWRQVKAHRAMAREAEARIQRVLAAYKDLVSAPRYQEIQQETETVLGEQLNALLEVAGKCPRCAPIASRIRLLRDIVLRPVQMVWYESQVDRLTPDDELSDDTHATRPPLS